MNTICSDEQKNALRIQLLINIFDILEKQGFLSVEENNCLKLEMINEAGRGKQSIY